MEIVTWKIKSDYNKFINEEFSQNVNLFEKLKKIKQKKKLFYKKIFPSAASLSRSLSLYFLVCYLQSAEADVWDSGDTIALWTEILD